VKLEYLLLEPLFIATNSLSPTTACVTAADSRVTDPVDTRIILVEFNVSLFESEF
jgi:hypothetical protein